MIVARTIVEPFPLRNPDRLNFRRYGETEKSQFDKSRLLIASGRGDRGVGIWTRWKLYRFQSVPGLV